jgi:pimeloyl-ACP methyl ester carboxylesterase
MSSSVCIARDTRKHRQPLSSGLFLSEDFPRLRKGFSLQSGSNPFLSRILISSALWMVAVLAVACPASIVAQDARALSLAASVPLARGCGAVSDRSGSNPPGSSAPCRPHAPLIVIGFMGGHVRADNLVHREAWLARDLDSRYPNAVRAMTFANRDEAAALHSLLNLLDTDKDGRLSDNEKSAARIVLFGHSWGASETVNLAQELGRRGIPVLLTIQVDSVRKHGEQDGSIPANVREAINFYQTEGMLHGRRSIHAMDPMRTTILGSYESTYKTTRVSCAGFPWFARTFMMPHIEIENDAAVWKQIEALIVARS